MTAEIAIINRSAVTLAADSAMTLSVRGAEKVYTSADKLFELSAHDPIGIMIYNNLEFLGAPLDVVLKQFRDSEFCCPFDSLRDAPAALFHFLMTDFAPSEENQQKHARDIVMNVFRQIPDECINEAGRLIRKYPRKRPSVQEVFSSVVEAHLEEYEKEPVADCFSDLTEDGLMSICGDAIDQAIKLLGDFPGTSGATEQLRRLGLLVLHRNVFSELLTGLVFAGFGKKEVFPSAHRL